MMEVITGSYLEKYYSKNLKEIYFFTVEIKGG